MKALYYLIFSIYKFYTDVIKEKDIPLFYTSVITTVFLIINLISVYFALVYFELVDVKTSVGKYFIVVASVLLWGFIHFIIVRPRKFLKPGFKGNKTGKIMILAYIILTVIAAVTAANYNRSKVLRERTTNLHYHDRNGERATNSVLALLRAGYKGPNLAEKGIFSPSCNL